MDAFSLGQRGHLASASGPCQHILRPRQPVCCYWIFNSYRTQDTFYAIHTNNFNLTSVISALLLPIWCPVYAKGSAYINFTVRFPKQQPCPQGGRLHPNERSCFKHFRKVGGFFGPFPGTNYSDHLHFIINYTHKHTVHLHKEISSASTGPPRHQSWKAKKRPAHPLRRWSFPRDRAEQGPSSS